jgi:gliding motility-associated protein GldC
MKKSTIEFEIELDGQNVPEKIYWRASDNPSGDGKTATKSMSVAIWDHDQQNTMRIDLWSKDMPVDDMKRFYIDSIGGLAQSILTSTGDEVMAGEINKLCDRLVEHVKTSKEKG